MSNFLLEVVAVLVVYILMVVLVRVLNPDLAIKKSLGSAVVLTATAFIVGYVLQCGWHRPVLRWLEVRFRP